MKQCAERINMKFKWIEHIVATTYCNKQKFYTKYKVCYPYKKITSRHNPMNDDDAIETRYKNQTLALDLTQ